MSYRDCRLVGRCERCRAEMNVSQSVTVQAASRKGGESRPGRPDTNISACGEPGLQSRFLQTIVGMILFPTLAKNLYRPSEISCPNIQMGE